MLVSGGQQVNFNYGTYDEATGLNVAALLYDVTSGTPSQVGSVVAMSDEGSSGIYVGAFTPLSGHFYLVIMMVYLDSGFTMPDPSRAPSPVTYEAPTTDTSFMSFCYGAFDQNAGLTIDATTYDITDSTNTTQEMTYVTLGVYYGRSIGVVGSNYMVAQIPTDVSRPPNSQSFQVFSLDFNNTTNVLRAATLTGQNIYGVLVAQ